jgi:tRNA (guanine-N7-)-methyltransferase
VVKVDVNLDEKGIKRLSSKVNRYFEKLFDYQDRLFTGFNLEEDKLKLENLFEQNPNSSIILEFGSGSGGHLISLAKLKHDSILIGFETRFKRPVRTIEKAEKSDCQNVYIIRTRSENSPALISNRKVREVYINFPDPWEKKRQRKHRILSAKTLYMISGMMESGGIVSVKTDHPEYFNSFLEEFKADSNLPFVIEYMSEDLTNFDCNEAEIKTEFEQLFMNQGIRINYVRFRKK